MAKIQVDLDQVMRFGKLHADIGRSLDAHRNVFRGDSNRLDRIMAEFGLTRSLGGSTFQGMSIAAAMGDADARAARVANTLVTTSSRIFKYAGASQTANSHFGLGSQLGQAIWGAMASPFGIHLVEMVGGELAGIANSLPRLLRLAPIFIGITGVLDIVDAATSMWSGNTDGWTIVAAALKAGSGVIGIGVTVGLIVFGAPFLGLVGGSFLVVGAVFSFAALAIMNRKQLAELATAAATGIGKAISAVAETVTEVGQDLLRSASDLWGKTAKLFGFAAKGVEDVAFSATEVVRGLLGVGTLNLFRPLHLTPLASHTPGSAIPLPGARLVGGSLQGSAPSLQGGSTTPLQGGAKIPPQGPTKQAPTANLELSRSEEDLRTSFLKEWKWTSGSKGAAFDQWGFGYDDNGNSRKGDCTSYVAWRLNQLAKAKGLGDNYFSNNKLGDQKNLIFGGAERWDKQSTKLGKAPDLIPKPGAVAWFKKGHVAVVRSVNLDGSITIEHSSWDEFDFKLATVRPGEKGYPTSFLHLLPGT